jgi:hypothetical protein
MPFRARNASPPTTRSAKRLRQSGKRKSQATFPRADHNARRLIKSSDFLDSFEEELSNEQIHLIDEVLTDSIRLAYEGQIDFDDQIYMPTLFGGTFPRFPLVMVDEAQDLQCS